MRSDVHKTFPGIFECKILDGCLDNFLEYCRVKLSQHVTNGSYNCCVQNFSAVYPSNLSTAQYVLSISRYTEGNLAYENDMLKIASCCILMDEFYDPKQLVPSGLPL